MDLYNGKSDQNLKDIFIRIPFLEEEPKDEATICRFVMECDIAQATKQGLLLVHSHESYNSALFLVAVYCIKRFSWSPEAARHVLEYAMPPGLYDE